MKSIIHELYSGNIAPADKPLYKNPKLKTKMGRAADIEEQLRKLLDGPAQQLFEEFSEIQTDITILDGEERFTDGFKLGMRFAAESLTDGKPKAISHNLPSVD